MQGRSRPSQRYTGPYQLGFPLWQLYSWCGYLAFSKLACGIAQLRPFSILFSLPFESVPYALSLPSSCWGVETCEGGHSHLRGGSGHRNRDLEVSSPFPCFSLYLFPFGYLPCQLLYLGMLQRLLHSCPFEAV